MERFGDSLGSVEGLTDATGALLGKAHYQAFGGGALPEKSRFGFTGREFDPETGLYYYRARYYDPQLGRLISEDPIRFEAGETNLQRYVGNGPTYARDPSGLMLEYSSMKEVGKAGAIGATLQGSATEIVLLSQTEAGLNLAAIGLLFAPDYITSTFRARTYSFITSLLAKMGAGVAALILDHETQWTNQRQRDLLVLGNYG